MAHFYASIQGNRSERTCVGTKNSGIDGHVRGWDIGCESMVRWNEQEQRNEVTIYLTHGSGYGGPQNKCLGTFTLTKNGKSYKKLK